MVLAIRRGLRTRLFVTCFIALHALMLGGFLVQDVLPLLPATTVYRTIVAQWTLFLPAFLFLIVLPVSCLFSQARDLDRTLTEPMLTTSVTPFGIVLGVWMSKVLEAFLMASTLMPYMVLRYFMSGSNPFLDTAGLMGLVAASSCFCAIAIALCTIPGMVMRLTSAVGIGLPISFYLLIIFVTVNKWMSGTGPTGIGMLWISMLVASLCAVAALGNAAASVGSATFNGAPVARYCAVAMSGAWILWPVSGFPSMALIYFQIVTGLPLLLSTMLRHGRYSEEELPGMAKVMETGKLRLALMLPGWQSGVWWVLLITVLWSIPHFSPAGAYQSWKQMTCPALGSLCFPFVFQRLVEILTERSIGTTAERLSSLFYALSCYSLLIPIGIMSTRLEVPDIVRTILPPLQLINSFFHFAGSEQVSLAPALSLWPVVVLMVMSGYAWIKITEQRFERLLEAKLIANIKRTNTE
ncbi:MAG: hypothetical protein ACAI35_25910 [Candidatus Methylacidiphilales bacterium]